MEIKPYSVVESKTVFKGIILDVTHTTLKLPNGKECVREVVLRGPAAAVIPVDENGNIIFVRQYRHPAGKMVLEIPAGMADGSEEPHICAARELTEETGKIAGELILLSKIYSAIGFCTEEIYIYCARNLSQGEQHFDEDEFITLESYSLDEAVEMIFNGKIVDPKTIIAILAYKEKFVK